jgi:transposase-like protein
MDKEYRTYTKEFKQDALELLEGSGKSASELERELGITTGLLLKWRRRYKVGQESHSLEPSLWRQPTRACALKRRGVVCGHNRVARLMHCEGIVGKSPWRKHPVTTQREPGNRVAPNVLARNFAAELPNRKWVADITYIDTAEGWLYLARFWTCGRAWWSAGRWMNIWKPHSWIRLCKWPSPGVVLALDCSITPTRVVNTPAPGPAQSAGQHEPRRKLL